VVAVRPLQEPELRLVVQPEDTGAAAAAAVDSTDDEAFGSEDETWREDIGRADSVEGFDKEEDDVGFEVEWRSSIAQDHSSQLDYTLMLEDMQAILRLPSSVQIDSDGNTVQDDDFDDNWVEMPKISEDDYSDGAGVTELACDAVDAVIDFHGAEGVVGDVYKDDEGAQLNLNAFMEEVKHSSDKEATRDSQMLRLNIYLSRKLGEGRFQEAYKFLKLGDVLEIEEDPLLEELERLLGVDGLVYLDELFTLLALETEKNS
jgi:hypothetical protein